MKLCVFYLKPVQKLNIFFKLYLLHWSLNLLFVVAPFRLLIWSLLRDSVVKPTWLYANSPMQSIHAQKRFLYLCVKILTYWKFVDSFPHTSNLHYSHTLHRLSRCVNRTMLYAFSFLRAYSINTTLRYVCVSFVCCIL